ncbi:ferredoxin reductase domain-containing protein [Xenorhabdus nematophila]|uniref:hypothetical protein n=1 Tax=Xenorhabdus nematophila TaxID=628 RepID=UPI000907D297|nr:hypothetical protein [Xenorhabdus nematophila]
MDKKSSIFNGDWYIPKDDGYIKIHVAKNKNGLFSDLICEKLEVNDLLWIYGPYGDFTAQNRSEMRDIVFVATGTGFAPIKSLVESGVFNENKVSLFFGAGEEIKIIISP